MSSRMWTEVQGLCLGLNYHSTRYDKVYKIYVIEIPLVSICPPPNSYCWSAEAAAA